MALTTLLSAIFLNFEVHFNAMGGYLVTFLSMCLYYTPSEVLLSTDTEFLSSVDLSAIYKSTKSEWKFLDWISIDIDWFILRIHLVDGQFILGNGGVQMVQIFGEETSVDSLMRLQRNRYEPIHTNMRKWRKWRKQGLQRTQRAENMRLKEAQGVANLPFGLDAFSQTSSWVWGEFLETDSDELLCWCWLSRTFSPFFLKILHEAFRSWFFFSSLFSCTETKRF